MSEDELEIESPVKSLSSLSDIDLPIQSVSEYEKTKSSYLNNFRPYQPEISDTEKQTESLSSFASTVSENVPLF